MLGQHFPLKQSQWFCGVKLTHGRSLNEVWGNGCESEIKRWWCGQRTFLCCAILAKQSTIGWFDEAGLLLPPQADDLPVRERYNILWKIAWRVRNAKTEDQSRGYSGYSYTPEWGETTEYFTSFSSVSRSCGPARSEQEHTFTPGIHLWGVFFFLYIWCTRLTRSR